MPYNIGALATLNFPIGVFFLSLLPSAPYPSAQGRLALDLVTEIVEGKHPITLSTQTLRSMPFPPKWTEQRTMISAASAS
ncbi:MAG: hypothetical protein QM773_04945 [Hyphomonadaceae bacterium]